ncbi:MAG: hypothetical protein J6866_01625 [Victivallales bacterium]|nr:hypothetical protein [Victivallales bacterium]
MANILRLLLIFSLGFLCAHSSSADDDLLTQIESLETKGAAYLLAKQADNGAWLPEIGQPAITALACLGLHHAASLAPDIRARLDKALDYIVGNARPDGAIAGAPRRGGRGGGRPSGSPAGGRGGRGGPGGQMAGSYTVYNTAICLVALAKFNRPQDVETMRRARAYLLGPDASPEGLPLADSSGQGGIGYGQRQRADLSNTAWTLEALHATDYLDREPFSQDPQAAAKAGLAWDKALQFLTICQNLQDTNQSAWVKDAPAGDRGGFIYSPADALKEDRREEALRSYGSMTYAGLKSLIYAKVSKDDVRMTSAWDWVKRYYTVDQNPGVGQAGLFYYLHTFSKTLALFGEPTITDANGTAHDWKRELVAKLQATQATDGSWVNAQSGRWMESVPELVTAYALMSLEFCR